MKANELRIGNWVKYPGVPDSEIGFNVKVENIANEGINMEPTYDGVYVPYWFDDLRPISLTPEILEKCGFVKEYEFMTHINMDANGIPADDVGHKTFVIDGFDCRLRLVDRIDSGVYYVYAEYDENKVHVAEPQYYLHQLQNLYYCLVGEELEINL